MPSPHFPNLDTLRRLEDEEVRFYAVIGAVMSLTAALEIAYFDVFQEATKLPTKTAAAIFYEIINTSTRRDMAGNALTQTLDDPLKADWLGLYDRIKRATGRSGHRNLLGHGQVSVTTTSVGGSGMLGFGPLGAGPIGSVPTVRYEFQVQQDEMQILAGKRDPQEVDFESLITFSEEVIKLIVDLEQFLARVP